VFIHPWSQYLKKGFALVHYQAGEAEKNLGAAQLKKKKRL